MQVVENQMQVWRQGRKLDEVRTSRSSWVQWLIIFFSIFTLLFDIGCLWLLWDAHTQHSLGEALLFLLLLLAAPFIAIIPELLSLAHAMVFVLSQRSHLSNAFVSPLTVLLVVSPLVIPLQCA